MRKYYIYILASKRNGTLYVGVTGNLHQRISTHKQKAIKGFTEKYNVTQLVYYQEFNTFQEAVLAEKRIKAWKREWKLNLIEKDNPNWDDLAYMPGFPT